MSRTLVTGSALGFTAGYVDTVGPELAVQRFGQPNQRSERRAHIVRDRC